MPDPKLKAAMAEVEAIIKKYDIAGTCVLVSPTHMEYTREYSPSWSCVTLEKAPDGKGWGIRIRALRKDFPSEEAHKKCLEASTGMLLGLLDFAEVELEQLTTVAGVMVKHMHIEHMTQEEEKR